MTAPSLRPTESWQKFLSGAQNQQDSGQAQESTSGSGSSSGTASQSGGSSQDTNYISADKAQSIALQHAGVSASDATFRKAHLDRDDGIYVYELEFVSGDLEYDYEIHATTGAIGLGQRQHLRLTILAACMAGKWQPGFPDLD